MLRVCLLHPRKFDVLWAFVVAAAFSFPLNAAADETVAPDWPNGTIEQTCAPYDGPAFLILSKRLDGTFVRLMGMDSIKKANGTWAVVLGAEPGKGAASICDLRKPAESRCAIGRSGGFTVRQSGANEWRIEFSATFLQAGRVNDAHGTFKVTRPKQSTGRSRLCG